MEKYDEWLRWCRLCAKIQTKPHIDIFFKNEEKQDLVKILEQYYFLEVSEEDKLPKTVCESCYASIQNHLGFINNVTRTQEMFSDLLHCGLTDKKELNELRQRYNLDTNEEVEERDIKVGFVDFNPMIDCEVLVEADNIKNPLDEPPSSNDEVFLNEDHFDEGQNEFEDEENENGVEDGKNFRLLEEHEIKMSPPQDSDEEKKTKLPDEEPSEVFLKPNRRRKRQKKAEINYAEKDDDEDDDAGSGGADGGFCDGDEDFIEKQKNGNHLKKRKIRKDKMLTKLDCSECSYKSWRSNDLKWHMISKHGRPVDDDHKFVCTQCSKAFRNQHYLNRHLETHLPGDQRRTWPCPHCDKLFSSSNNAKIHMKHIHFNESQFICEECGFIAKTTGSLKQHMETHLPVAKYECPQCGQRIRSKYRLKVHMDTHNPDRFPCKICNLKFSSRLTLKNHLVIHSDAMPYKCDSCGRGFKLSKYLKSHLLTHTGLKHYSCRFCDRQFAHSANCRLHMKKEHPEQLAKLDAEGGPKKTTSNVPTLQALKAFAKNVPSGTSDEEPPLFTF